MCTENKIIISYKTFANTIFQMFGVSTKIVKLIKSYDSNDYHDVTKDLNFK